MHTTFLPLHWALSLALITSLTGFILGFILGVRCRACRMIRKNSQPEPVTRINSIVPPNRERK